MSLANEIELEDPIRSIGPDATAEFAPAGQITAPIANASSENLSLAGEDDAELEDDEDEDDEDDDLDTEDDLEDDDDEDDDEADALDEEDDEDDLDDDDEDEDDEDEDDDDLPVEDTTTVTSRLGDAEKTARSR